MTLAATSAKQSAISGLELLILGVVTAVAGILILNAVGPNPLEMMDSRIIDLRLATEGLARTGLPLYYATTSGSGQAIGVTDDQGLYIIVPYFAWVFHIHDALTAYRILWLSAWGIVFFGAPYFCSRLFTTRAAIYLTPLTTIVAVLSLGFADIYWVQAWSVLALLPPLMIVWVRQKVSPSSIAVLVAVAMAAGAVGTIRSNSGVPILIALAIVATTMVRPWWRSSAVLALVLVAYLSVNYVVLEAVRSYRDNRAGTDLSAAAPGSHPFWHTAYIGLGYLPNRHNISYRDSVAAEAAGRRAPHASYLSPAYDRALRDETISVVSEAPTAVAVSTAKKLTVVLYQSAPYLLLIILSLPALFVTRHARLCWLALPAVLIGTLPSLVAIPYRFYAFGSVGGLILIGLIGTASACDLIGTSLASSRGNSFGMRIKGSAAAVVPALPVKRLVTIALVAITLLTAVVVLSKSFQASASEWLDRQPTVSEPQKSLEQ